MMSRFIATTSLIAALLSGLDAQLTPGSTTNNMPDSAGGKCETGDCMQGLFFTDALQWKSHISDSISFVNAKSIGGEGWPAGPVTMDLIKKLFKWPDQICTMKVRGETLVRIFHESTTAKTLAGTIPGEGSDVDMLQVRGLRVTYNTELAATKRLVKLEHVKQSGEVSDIDRSALYTIVATKFVVTKKPPYSKWTSSPLLDGETAPLCKGDVQQTLFDYVSVEKHVTLPVSEIGKRVVKTTTGTAMKVEQTALTCFEMTPPHIYDKDIGSCVSCPTGQSTTDGQSCSGGTPAASSTMKTTNAMPTQKCTSSDCVPGFFVTDAMRYWAGDGAKTIAITNGKSIAGKGWLAGFVNEANLKGLFAYENKMCKMKLRGQSIVRLLQTSMSSKHLSPSADGGNNYDIIQFSGMRVQYSSTLPPMDRLLAVEVQDPSSLSEYMNIDRAAIYELVINDYDALKKSPYTDVLKKPKLPGEQGPVCSMSGIHTVMTAYLKKKTPLTLHTVTGSRIIESHSGMSMSIEQDKEVCLAMSLPHRYDNLVECCVPCPPGGTTTDGLTCRGGSAPTTHMATHNAMPAAGDLCTKEDCAQGSLFTDALRWKMMQSATGPVVAYVNGKSLGGPGWTAGQVSKEDLTNLKKYDDPMCHAQVRGTTLLRIAREHASSKNLDKVQGGENVDILQFAGMRVFYNPHLSAENRVVKVQVLNVGSWRQVVRGTLYTIVATDFDMETKHPYNKHTKTPQLPGETPFKCENEGVIQVMEDFLRSFTVKGTSYVIPVKHNFRSIHVHTGYPISMEMTPADCLKLPGHHYYNMDTASCAACPEGHHVLSTGVSCVEGPNGKALVITATELAVATTHAQLLSGGMEGCRKAGVRDFKADTCTNGLVEAVMNLRTQVPTPTDDKPAPIFIPTADYADELLSMHPKRWAIQCEMLTRFKATAFQTTSIDLSYDQEVTSIPWSCPKVALIQGNADFYPPLFWYQTAQPIHVDAATGLAVTVALNMSGTRAKDIFGGIATAAAIAEANEKVKAFVVLVQGADPTVIAEELNNMAVFATAVVATTKHMDPVRVGKIWVGGKSAISSSNMRRLALTKLKGPFKPHVPMSGAAAALVEASGLELKHFNPPKASDRVADAHWQKDQEFMQKFVDEAFAHNPVVGHSDNAVPPTEKTPTSTSICQRADCMQGLLVANAIREAAGGGVSIALFGSSSLNGKGWPVGPIKMSDVYDMHKYPNFICTQKLRGETLIQMMHTMVLSAYLKGKGNGTEKFDTLQMSGIRVTYSTTLEPSHRLTGVEVVDPATGNWVAINRAGLYTIASSDYDLLSKYPYRSHTMYPKLLDEERPKCTNQVMQDIIVEYIETASPLNIPTAARLIPIVGGAPLLLEETPEYCRIMAAPHYFEKSLDACAPCPTGLVSMGTHCVTMQAASSGLGSGSSSTGIIVGVVIGGLLVVGLTIGVAVFIVRRRNSEPRSEIERFVEYSEMGPAAVTVEKKEDLEEYQPPQPTSVKSGVAPEEPGESSQAVIAAPSGAAIAEVNQDL